MNYFLKMQVQLAIRDQFKQAEYSSHYILVGKIRHDYWKKNGRYFGIYRICDQEKQSLISMFFFDNGKQTEFPKDFEQKRLLRIPGYFIEEEDTESILSEYFDDCDWEIEQV